MRSADDYLHMLLALLPTGPAWRAPIGSVLRTELEAMAQELARVEAALELALDECDPQTTQLMLLEWETELGLPDECSELYETVAERRGAVLAKLTDTGGMRPEDYEELAMVYAEEGYVVRVVDYQPFVVDGSSVGEALTNDEWTYAFGVQAPGITFRDFNVGVSVAGEPLRTWGNTKLACVIDRYKPAHAVAVLEYTEEE